MLTSADIVILKKSLAFWDQLTEEQRDLLIESSNICHYERGSTLHCANDNCLGVLHIKKGTLRVYLLSEEGREVTLYRLDEGDICILSASCILDAITFDVYIDAETECEVIQTCPKAFSKINSENIYAENFAHKLVTERFSEVMWAMQQILFTSFDKRLATFLLDESLKQNSDTLHMTHEQVAKYMGSAREVVSRMLKYFSTEGLVTLSRGDITLVDKKKLRELVS